MCQLLDMSGDILTAIGTCCADPLGPTVAVTLSSTCKALRTPLWPVLELLQQRHKRATNLCRTVGNTHQALSCAQLRDAQELIWSQRRLTVDDMATLGMILRIRGLPRLRELRIKLDWIAFGDAGMQALCEGLHSGSLPELHALYFQSNNLGPTGADALAAALRRGVIPKLAELSLSGNPIGDEGAAALAEPLRKLPLLEQLSLADCCIGDEGVASLFAGLDEDDFKTLGLLWLDNNRLTDKSCTLLASGRDGTGALPALWKLLVGKNPASDAAHKAVAVAYAKRHAMRMEQALCRYVQCSQ
eukprot:1844063-Prymnesium_polylepis.3